MSNPGPVLVCEGCGHVSLATSDDVFTCPRRDDDDDVDHLLVPVSTDATVDESATTTFARYRRRLLAFRLAVDHAGWSDDRFLDLVGSLDDAVAATCGTGFRTTPLVDAPRLATRVTGADTVLVKDETATVGRSHKARHLMGVLLFIEVRRRLAESAASPRLAIASCGNAALAAAILARAAGLDLDAFVPTDAHPAILADLHELGATTHICRRETASAGDPCLAAFRAAVAGGALPFCCQGTECGVALDGGRTLAWEIAEAADAQEAVIAVQIGGGALGSSLLRGFETTPLRPRLLAVQSAGCAPLAGAWARFREGRDASGVTLDAARRNRSRYMAPWPAIPKSIAEGILDDETYDWAAIVDWLDRTHGDVAVVDDEDLAAAPGLLETATGIRSCVTGAAGLAGLLAAGSSRRTAVVIATGGVR